MAEARIHPMGMATEPTPDGCNDATLIARSLQAPERFAAVFDKHAPAIYSYVARRLGRDGADDIVAEAFLIAFQRRGEYDLTRGDARPWLYGIATNLIRHHRRDEIRLFRAVARAGSCAGTVWATEPRCSCHTTRDSSTALGISSPTPPLAIRHTSSSSRWRADSTGSPSRSAWQFYWDYAGEVPLVLKLNGKTDIPAIDPLSPLNATVEDAVRLGADAVGYPLYVGSPAQEHDFSQLRNVREDALRLGLPLIVWSYPRGAAVDGKGGKDSFYAVDYAARTASELGADVVKVNFPHPEKQAGVPQDYARDISPQQAIDAVVGSAGRTLLLVSGGERAGDEVMLEKARQSMEAGATGLIFGRNVWQRDHDESLRFAGQLRAILAKYPSPAAAGP